MKIIDFLKKYKLIIFLATLVFILAFIKIYFKDETTNNSGTSIKTINISPTSTPTVKEISSATSEDRLNLEKLSTETLQKYKEVKTEEQFVAFYNELSPQEQEVFTTEESPNEYCLESLLPYESETFIVKNYTGENLLLVKAKGSDFAKSKSDLKEWLKQNECEAGKHVFVWEE
jgi:hypothetical protein